MNAMNIEIKSFGPFFHETPWQNEEKDSKVSRLQVQSEKHGCAFSSIVFI